MDEEYCEMKIYLLKEKALEILHLYYESQFEQFENIYQYPEQAKRELNIEIEEFKNEINEF